MAHITVLTGASRGLGAALAEQLLQPNGLLLCISRGDNPTLTRTALAMGAPLEQWALDLADCIPIANSMQGWLAAKGGHSPDSVTLINNAAVLPNVTPLSSIGQEELQQALRVGLEAPMQLTAAFLAATATWSCSRKVLNISSGLGRYAMASQAAYCATKAGLDHFTRCVALEEAQQLRGAKLCALAPGVIDTAMQIQLRNTPESDFPDVGRFRALHADGQLTRPEDTARKILDYLRRTDFGYEPVADIRNL